MDDIKNPEVYKRRLHGELIHRDSEQIISTHTNPLTLAFRDASLEAQYRDSRDITSCVALVGLPLTLGCISLAYFLVGPIRLHIMLTLLLCWIVLIVKAFICTVPIVYTVSLWSILTYLID